MRRHASLAAALLAASAMVPAPVLRALGAAQSAGPVAEQDPRREVLGRTPGELARAEAGLWKDLFAGRELNAEALKAVDREVLAALPRAEGAYRAEDYPGALLSYYSALDRAPDFPPALLGLGNTYYRLRRYEDLVSSLSRFVEVAESQVFRTQALAHGLYSLGEYEAARAHYERVLAAMDALEIPRSPEAERGLGLCHMRLGDNERALEILRDVVAQRPKHVDARNWIAQILFDEERLEEAREEVLIARSLDPYDPRPWFLLSRILLESGEDEEAAEVRARWEELDRAEQAARALEARILYDDRAYAAAMELVDLQLDIGNARAVRDALEQAARRRPPDVSEADLRGFALHTLVEIGDYEGAAIAARDLERCCPDRRTTWEALAVYYSILGDHAAELRALKQLGKLPADGE